MLIYVTDPFVPFSASTAPGPYARIPGQPPAPVIIPGVNDGIATALPVVNNIAMPMNPVQIPMPMQMNPPFMGGGMGPPLPVPAPQHMGQQGPPLPLPQGPPPLPPLVGPQGQQPPLANQQGQSSSPPPWLVLKGNPPFQCRCHHLYHIRVL